MFGTVEAYCVEEVVLVEVFLVVVVVLSVVFEVVLAVVLTEEDDPAAQLEPAPEYCFRQVAGSQCATSVSHQPYWEQHLPASQIVFP